MRVHARSHLAYLVGCLFGKHFCHLQVVLCLRNTITKRRDGIALFVNVELVHERELRLCGGLVDAGDDRTANSRLDRVYMA